MKRSGSPIAGLLIVGLASLSAGTPAAGALTDQMAEARRAFEAGDADRARSGFLEIIRKHGTDNAARDAWFYLALLTRPGLDYVQYLDQFLEHGGRRDRRGPYVELRAGRYYYSLGEYRTALTRFESARELRRDDPAATAEARYWVGLSLMALREPAEARRALEEAAASKNPEPVRQSALLALAEVFQASRDHAAAARAFARYRDTFPKGSFVAPALYGEALALELSGRKREAAELYEQIVARFPAYPEAGQARQRLRAAKEPVPPTETTAPVAEPSELPAGADTTTVPASREVTPEPSGWSVQVGAFAAEENALTLADALTARGYSRVRVERGSEEPVLWHVLFGSYADQGRAGRAGEEVSATLGVDFEIVPPALESGQ